jgi:hypothetical protein
LEELTPSKVLINPSIPEVGPTTFLAHSVFILVIPSSLELSSLISISFRVVLERIREKLISLFHWV